MSTNKPRYVWVVTYAYDYEGETVEAVYATKAAADKHPWGGDKKIVSKMRILKRPRLKP